MRVVIFCHSILSDWNHGNAHFLRGIITELAALGHEVRTYEPRDAWSVANLLAEHGEAPLDRVQRAYPVLRSVAHRHDIDTLDLDEACDGADLVLVHEWSDHALVRRLGERRARARDHVLLFHDTHHRAVSDADAMAAYDLRHYDGVLAFGEVIRELYLRRGWAASAWTWHEAADARRFHPPAVPPPSEGELVWIGNWGDEERSAELREFLIDPVREMGLRALVHGVRYPEPARAALAGAGIRYGGWLPNFEVPAVLARYRVTVHVPRRQYAHALPGIPTIRVFEALACGIPLISAPWEDSEGLFTPGRDFLVARDGAAMRRRLRDVLHDDALARELAAHGRSTILERHTCAHRARELLAIHRALAPSAAGADRTARATSEARGGEAAGAGRP